MRAGLGSWCCRFSGCTDCAGSERLFGATPQCAWSEGMITERRNEGIAEFDMTIEEIRKSTEYQVFDRKSARIDAKALAITIIAFANADGGRIAIGVEDD